MRSSIACARCRRSKVKCINNGVNTTCRACENSGRECTYPPPASNGGGGRRESIIAGHATAHGLNSGETPRRSRPKKAVAPTSQTLSTKESPRALVDALDWSLLTPVVWQQLFEIFKQHFSADLPFLHPLRFLIPLKQSYMRSPQMDSKDHSPPSQVPPTSHPLLLAFLALTARFHDDLVAHHSPKTSSRPSNPIVASEYYASAARLRLENSLDTPTLERTQALLMLGFHEWGMHQGLKAWITIGIAIRSAQVLGLQFEQELDDLPLACELAENSEVRHMGFNPDRLGRGPLLNKGDEAIEQEVRRRTFWSCFVMDRYLSTGKYRTSMLLGHDLRIQLPSSEKDFLRGNNVKTRLLDNSRTLLQTTRHGALERSHESENGYRAQYGSHWNERAQDDREKGGLELGEEGVLSRFIRAMDLYGHVVKWSCAGGRRTEEKGIPPWDEKSTFYNLRDQLADFKNALPADLELSEQNILTSVHEKQASNAPYILMHIVLLLCSMLLHREYVPFLPVNCDKPVGPLDPPLFPPDQYDIPAGFWTDSARELFSSARQLVDLLRICQEWNALVETPIVGFATYTAAFCGAYACVFPHMDQHRYMCHGEGFKAAQKALEIVGQMQKRIPMAKDWFVQIRQAYRYFKIIVQDNKRSKAKGSSEASTPEQYRHLSLREGGLGGGLEEYKLFEKAFKEFGSLEDVDIDMPDVDTDSVGRAGPIFEEGSESGSGTVKNENSEVVEGTPESASLRHQGDRWNAINSTPSIGTSQGMASLPHGQIPLPNTIVSPTQHTPVPPHPDYQGYKQQYGSPTSQQHPHPPPQSQPYPPIPAESAQRASLQLQEQVQPNQANFQSQTPQQWSAVKPDSSWSYSWQGEDLAAFMSGTHFAEFAKNEQTGWMSAIYYHS